MNEYIQALIDLNTALTKTVANQHEAIKAIAIKMRKLEVTVETGAEYPMSNAVSDIEASWGK